MDMNDDELVRQFLKSSTHLPADEGFSQRVMSRLPRRSINPARITTLEIITFAIGIAILLAHVDLLQVFCNASTYMLQTFAYLRYTDITISPLYIVAALVALTVWGGNKIRTSI